MTGGSQLLIFLNLRGKPKSLPQLESLPEDLKDHVTLFRRIEDFQKLDNLTKDIKWGILILTPSLVEISRQVHHDIRRRLPGL